MNMRRRPTIAVLALLLLLLPGCLSALVDDGFGRAHPHCPNLG